MVVVRDAVVDDAEAIAAVHVRGWQHAYAGGLVPQEHLDALSVAERTERWRRLLSQQADPSERCLVAEDADGAVVGFCAVGPVRDQPEGGAASAAVEGAGGGETAAGDGEVRAIYVDPHRLRQGAGRALLTAGEDHLRVAGYREAILWVHPDNGPARGFYEACGWEADGAHRHERLGDTLVPEVRYRRLLC